MGDIRLNLETDILGAVDLQPTFMPGGELPVAEGEAVVPVINRLLSRFQHAFATQTGIGQGTARSPAPIRDMSRSIR